MSWINSPGLALMERYLDVVNMRQALIATNVANIDTPGYHTRDVDFRGELMRVMNGEDTSMTSPFVVPVRGLTARPDGNNVSADREGMLLAEVQLQFKAATALIRSEFSGLTVAIREGQ
jgi:flagellar basal-body rod protein FlgB